VEQDNGDLIYSNQELKKENDALKVKLESLKTISDTPYNLSQSKAESYEVEMHVKYSHGHGNDQLDLIGQGAFGPLAIINPYALQHSEGLKVLEVNDGIATISLEGQVALWALNQAADYNLGFYDNEIKYILDETIVYLTPEEKIAVGIFKPGKAVRVVDQYEDKFFIKSLALMDSCEISHGWVNADVLGYYEDLSEDARIDVRVKPSHLPDWLLDDLKYFPYGVWASIYEETDDRYFLSIYGGGALDVSKDGIDPFIRKPVD